MSVCGSPLSGSNGFAGYCLDCRQEGKGSAASKIYHSQMNFVSDMCRRYPLTVSEWVEEDGFKFSWGGNGLEPALREREVSRLLADPLSVSVRLTTGCLPIVRQ